MTDSARGDGLPAPAPEALAAAFAALAAFAAGPYDYRGATDAASNQRLRRAAGRRGLRGLAQWLADSRPGSLLSHKLESGGSPRIHGCTLTR